MLAPFLTEAECLGVAVNGAPLAEAVFVSEVGWVLPVEVTLLDRVAVGVVADAAAGRVMA